MSTLNLLPAQAMFHLAGLRVQAMTSAGVGRLEDASQVSSSVLWAYHKSERDLFAKLPLTLPALGTPDIRSYRFSSRERFSLLSPEDWSPTEEDSYHFFLSEIAIRRMKDKVAEAVASFFDNLATTDMTAAIDKIAPVVEKLKSRVIAWRRNLPPRIRFDSTPHPAESEWTLHLRAAFFMQLVVMHRPFVYAAIHDPAPGLSVMTLAAECMVFTCCYLRSGHPTLAHHGRWLQMRHELVAISTMTASAAAGVKMPLGWHLYVRAKIRSLEYRQMESPLYKSYLDVIRAIQTHFSRLEDEGFDAWINDPIQLVVKTSSQVHCSFYIPHGQGHPLHSSSNISSPQTSLWHGCPPTRQARAPHKFSPQRTSLLPRRCTHSRRACPTDNDTPLRPSLDLQQPAMFSALTNPEKPESGVFENRGCAGG
ncbi:hypothetical protein F5X68DRAFT_273353 [Plectosphaerella plurivora]|uniref:Uncharacterized protein n=1 Tax=Plectosphaerella plurivora TaxID=936078 RepID=A0A9P9ABY1_9PEZI|nr:hypothetical protein F5X68DRAFT_273353 [Plectosphaerella plurivora]